MKFALIDAAKAWYNAAAYQALVPLRDEAIASTFMLIEEPSWDRSTEMMLIANSVREVQNQ